MSKNMVREVKGFTFSLRNLKTKKAFVIVHQDI